MDLGRAFLLAVVFSAIGVAVYLAVSKQGR